MYKRRHSVEIVLIALLKIRQVRGLVLLALDHSRLVPFSSILAVNHIPLAYLTPQIDEHPARQCLRISVSDLEVECFPEALDRRKDFGQRLRPL